MWGKKEKNIVTSPGTPAPLLVLSGKRVYKYGTVFFHKVKLGYKSCIKCAKKNAEKGTTIKPDGGGIKHA